MAQNITYNSLPEDAGQRLDTVLARTLGVSRTRVAALCKDGRVLLGGARPVKPSWSVRPGDFFTLPELEEAPRGSSAAAESIPLSVLFEDKSLLVVDKPAGMVVHPAPGHRTGTLVNALLGYINGPPDTRLDLLRPGIVHRLDKDTSGLLVVARTFEAHQNLSEQIKARRMSRVYLCLSWGHWPQREGTIDEPIGRSHANRKKMAVQTTDSGRTAVTQYRVMESFSVAELVEATLQTGRTHQIRVHFSHRGHPVVGDPLYGGRQAAAAMYSGNQRQAVRHLLELCGRQALHAHSLSFCHPLTGEKMRFTSPLPADFDSLLQYLREPWTEQGPDNE
jgi:23S rRNA pseudouridine1911/1915/1917 synthase